MKVVFLDIDGVLNNHTSWKNGYNGLHAKNVKAFNIFLKSEPETMVVISSAWRYMIPKAMTLEGFEYLLLVGGLDCKGRILDITEKDEIIPTRGAQIVEWLSRHPEIKHWLVLDDLIHDFFTIKFNFNFYQTRSGIGLIKSDIPHLIIRLKNETQANISS